MEPYSLLALGAIFLAGLLLLWLWLGLRPLRWAGGARTGAGPPRRPAGRDALTGLASWEGLQARLAETLAAAGAKAPVAAVMLDLDGLRAIRQGSGPTAAEEALQAAAQRLVRAVGASALVGRRGEQFWVVQAGIGAAQQAQALADKLLAALGEPLRLQGRDCPLGASAGLCLYPKDAADAATLLRHAEIAAHQARREGRGYRLFAADMKQAAEEQALLGKGLHTALERRQLAVHYHPIVDLASGGVAGVEALVRWSHPQLGLVPPARFIPLAEDNGSIAAIGEWTLREACRRGRAWHDAGHRGLQVAVNLSPRQFRQERLPERIKAILAETGFPPGCLNLEITESCLVQDPQRAARMLAPLKEQGVRVAADNFGTGHSSLTHLRHLPIDRLKIDRSFVGDCCTDRNNAAIIEALMGLARSLGLEVVAEGVESEAQLEFLRSRGCPLAQGHLFSPPLAAKDMPAVLAGGAGWPCAPP